MNQFKGVYPKMAINKTQHFIDKANTIHQHIYDYSQVLYINTDTKVEIVCPVHGSFFQTPRNHLFKKSGCNACAVERSKLTNTKTNDEFIIQSTHIHDNKYDYSRTHYKNANTKVEIVCPIHGSFFQTPSSHLRGNGCKKCAVRLTTEGFIDKANSIHNGKYDYCSTQYFTGKEKINISCPEHGIFNQRAESHLQGIGCPTCANERTIKISSGEQQIVDFIKSIATHTQIILNSRSIIHPREIDIYIPEYNVAIEYNGIYWHSELAGKDKLYHITKTNVCNKQNIHLIHILESEWLQNPKIVKSRLQAKLQSIDNTIYARKCSIENIPPKQARIFYNENHIQGFVGSHTHLGLVFNDRLVSCMSFTKSRFNKKYNWELTRFCSVINTRVIGGASKLFTHFTKQYPQDSIVSYSDKRWNTGSVYQALGFEFSHSSAPNYFYFKNLTLLSRQKFQKHKLEKQLSNFDPNLTEWENMVKHGYNRIWDCGNDVWVWSGT